MEQELEDRRERERKEWLRKEKEKTESAVRISMKAVKILQILDK